MLINDGFSHLRRTSVVQISCCRRWMTGGRKGKLKISNVCKKPSCTRHKMLERGKKRKSQTFLAEDKYRSSWKRLRA